VLEKFALQFRKLEDAVTAVIDFLGMQAVDNTRTVPPSDGSGKRTHTLHMSGKFLGETAVLVRAQLQVDESAGTSAQTVLKLAVRSADQTISQLVAECIR
jgi:hypothetical protein